MTTKSPKELSKLIKDLIDNKHIDDNCNDLLELKTLLSSADCRQIEEVLKEVNVSQFCNDLNTLVDHKNIDLIVNIFDIVFGNLSTDYILNNFQKEITNGLDAKDDSIVELWLKTLDRCLAHELALNHTINTNLDIHSILLKVIRLVSKPETSTAKHCHSIVFNVAKSDALNEKFFESDVQNLLTQTRSVGDIARMRVYELLVSVANTSHKTFCRIESFHHLNHLLEDFNKDSISDPLLTLNILQIMTDLGSTAFGTQYLQSSDILKTIAERLRTSENDIFGNLLVPGYIKIFGTLANNEPNILEKYPTVLVKLKALLNDLDPTLKLSSIEAIAIICTKTAGKLIINTDVTVADKYMTTIGQLITGAGPEAKTRALTALSIVLTTSEPDPNSHSSHFAEQWFNCLLPERQISTLLGLCREPYVNMRVSALECIRVVATYVWGHKQLAAFPGFLEYILDRKLENSKEGKEAKFAVVRELVVSPFINLSFTKEAVLQLRAFYKEGPYYVANETAVSFESN